MIAKGTTHNNGARLASYLTNGKAGERTELYQLRGFASNDIGEAFRSVHVMAEATRCEQPFMHVQVRNRDGEKLTREQWERAANRIEAKLGLTGQPRAIAFHIDGKTGQEHMHLAFSRIDQETMRARPVSFFKLRLKEVSRQIETEFGLTPVTNHRDGPVMAPKRGEYEQAKRLGVDINEVRKTIRNCWERSDTGRAFRAALATESLTLAKGDRRDFVVLDQGGGIHALGKRILGVTAAQIRNRMADLDPENLPTIEQARALIRERQTDKQARSRKETARTGERMPPAPPARQPWAAVGKEQGQGERSYGAGRAKIGFRKPSRILGKTLDIFAGAFESALSPTMTPEQKREANLSAREREDQADKQIDFSRYLADRQNEREQERTRERDKQRQRERDGREL